MLQKYRVLFKTSWADFCAVQRSRFSLAKEAKTIALRNLANRENHRRTKSKAAGTTILQIPDEVLAVIVEYVVLSLRHDSNITVSLSHVSRKFRRVLHGLSRFWTCISTDLSYERCRESLRLCQESGQAVSVHCKSLCQSREIFDLASSRPDLWEAFFLVVGVANAVPNSNIGLLTRLGEFDLLRLRRISLAYVDPSASGTEALDNIVHIYGELQTPNLDHLELMNIIPKRLQVNTALSISKLTLLFDPGWSEPWTRRQLPSLNWREVVVFLQETTAIEDLTLDLRVMDWFVSSPGGIVTSLPHVTSFSVRFEDVTLERPLWQELIALHLPNLQVFDFQLTMLCKNPKQRYGSGVPDNVERFKVDNFLNHLLSVNGGHFEHVSHLSLKLDIRIEEIKDNFHLPFHRFPKLERLHIQSNRNIFPPNSHQLKLIPTFRLRLKVLELINCSKMDNFAWMRRLAAHVRVEDLEKIVLVTDDDFPSSQPLLKATEKIFGRQRILLEEHIATRRFASSPFDSAFR